MGFCARTIHYCIKVAVDGSGNPALVQMWQSQIAGTSPVVANNELYFVGRNNRPITFFAVKPTTGELIWSDSSASNSIDYVGFASPIVADGHIYMTTGSSVVAIRLDGIFRNGFN
jgi:outer membrane protein assembly factor BamB